MHWYVLRSKPNKELSLWRELCAREVESFYPQLHVRPVNPRSRTIRPYFPGYLFLHLDMEHSGSSTFQWMPFSLGLVSFDGVPATVHESLLQAIRRHIDEINAVGGERLLGLKKGDVVSIQGGPFDGYEAIFDACLPGRDRVRVLLKLLQMRQVNVELATTQIERKKTKLTDCWKDRERR